MHSASDVFYTALLCPICPCAFDVSSLGRAHNYIQITILKDCNRATYVLVDVLDNMKDKNKMVLVQDDGGGITPIKMRQCMSLRYSGKSKMAETIGQYENGFRTGTMRLGADIVDFSCCQGKYRAKATQSIGLLSYTFLRSTGKEDIVLLIMRKWEKLGTRL